MGHDDGVSNIFCESYRIHSKHQIYQRRHEDCLIIAYEEHWQLISFPASKDVLLLDSLRTHFLVWLTQMKDSEQYVWTHCRVLCCYLYILHCNFGSVEILTCDHSSGRLLCSTFRDRAGVGVGPLSTYCGKNNKLVKCITKNIKDFHGIIVME